MSNKMKTVWFSANNTNDGGQDPLYGRFTLTSAFLDRLKVLQQLCDEHKLSELRVYDQPDTWGPESEDGEDFAAKARLMCGEFVLTAGQFWFRGVPKHADGSVQSISMSIDQLEEALNSAVDHHFFTDDSEDELMELIRDCGDVALPEDA